MSAHCQRSWMKSEEQQSMPCAWSGKRKSGFSVHRSMALICRIRASESPLRCVFVYAHIAVCLCACAFSGGNMYACSVRLHAFVYQQRCEWVCKLSYPEPHVQQPADQQEGWTQGREGGARGLRAKAAWPRWRGLSGALPIKAQPTAHSHWQGRETAGCTTWMYVQQPTA